MSVIDNDNATSGDFLKVLATNGAELHSIRVHLERTSNGRVIPASRRGPVEGS